MRLHVLHRTTFVYDGHARDSFNEVRLRPFDDSVQSCRQFALRLEPGSLLREFVDFHGNTVHYFDIAASHAQLTVEAESEVETVADVDRPAVPIVSLAQAAQSPEREMQAEFYSDSFYVRLDGEFRREAEAALNGTESDTWSTVCRLGRHVRRTFAYRPNLTEVSTLATDALNLRAGVCQDFAHVLLGLCRISGIPTRYVSGYFLNRSRRPGEIEASHAWVEAFLPGFGWAPYDPTHDRPADERYVKVAVGRDYADVGPVCGTYRGSPTRELRVEVFVRETPALAVR